MPRRSAHDATPRHAWLFTSLTSGGSFLQATDVGVSSLTDTWLLLRDKEQGAERNRLLYLVKSRGMAHSNQVREFLLTDHGVKLRDVYVGPSGALVVGSARDTLEAQEQAQALARKQEAESKNRELQRKRHALKTRIAVLRAEFEVEQAEAVKMNEQDQMSAGVLTSDRVQMALLRQSDVDAAGKTAHRAAKAVRTSERIGK